MVVGTFLVLLLILTVVTAVILSTRITRKDISGDTPYVNDFLISGVLSVALSPIVIILISVIVDEWPDGYAGIGPNFIMIWGVFAMIGTVIFFIISLFTDEGLAAILRGYTDGKEGGMILPSSLPPSDTISEWETKDFPLNKKENVIESEKVPDVEADSSMKELEKLIEKRNVGEVTSEEFEEMKKEILERKPQYSKDPIEIAQEEVHGDDVPKKENQDSVINRSNIGGGSSKMQELERLTEMKEKGLIDDDEFKQMKKEILGK